MKHRNLRNKNLNEQHYRTLCHSKHLKRLQSIHKQMSYQMKDIQKFQKKTLHKVEHFQPLLNYQEKQNSCSLPKLNHSNSYEHKQNKENYLISKRKNVKLAELVKQKKKSYLQSKIKGDENINTSKLNFRKSQSSSCSFLKKTSGQRIQKNIPGTQLQKSQKAIFVKVGTGSPTYKIYLEILPERFKQVQSEITGSSLKYFLEIIEGNSTGKSSVITLQQLIKNKIIIYLVTLESPNQLIIKLINQSLYKNSQKFHMIIELKNNSGVQTIQNAYMQILSVKGYMKNSLQLPVKITCKKIQKKFNNIEKGQCEQQQLNNDS